MNSQDLNKLPQNPAKKEWAKPEVVIINENTIQSGGNTSLVETAFAHPTHS